MVHKPGRASPAALLPASSAATAPASARAIGAAAAVSVPTADRLDASPRAARKHEALALHDLGLEPLLGRVAALSDAAVLAAIAATEDAHPLPSGKEMAALLADLHVGDLAQLPLHAIHPGQVQLSLTNVREKMGDFVERVDERRTELADAKPKKKSKAAATLLDASEALTAIIGPGGRSLILTDGHHHIAGLKALQQVVGKIVGPGLSHGGRPSRTAPGQELAFVHGLFGGPQGTPNVPIRIVGDLRAVPAADFWALLASGVDGKKLAYLTTREGEVRSAAPARFSSLQDNPYRFFASLITGKIEIDEKSGGKNDLVLRGGDPPVWLKVLGAAPDFIEFHLARIVEDAFTELGRTFDPAAPLTADDRAIARYALFRAQRDVTHPQHEAVRDLAITTQDRSLEKLDKKLEHDDGEVRVPKKLTRPSKRRLAQLEKRFQALKT